MFGTDCWYRGKYGNYLLSIIDADANQYGESGWGYDFYGNGFGDGEEGISVDDCLKNMWKLIKQNKVTVKLFEEKPSEKKLMD